MDQESQNNPPSNPQQAEQHKGHRTLWIVLGVLAVLLAVITIRHHHKAIEKEKAAQAALANVVPSVETTIATTGTSRHYLNALGTVTALNTVLVRSRIDGQIMKVFFHEGQFVQQGALLAQIDPRPAEVQLMQANGQMMRDQASFTQAEMDLKRYDPLAQHQAIPQQQRDQQAALVQQYRGAMQTDEGQIANAKLQLTYSKITAPISGRIGLRMVDAGNIVHANDAAGLVSITEINPITVVFNLAEADVPVLQQALSKNPQLAVEAWDRSNQIHVATGRILSLDNSIDAASGTLKVKATFANEHGELFPNEFVNIRVMAGVSENALLVPGTVVQRNGDTAYVYVVDRNNIAHMRAVKTGESDAGSVEILSGLQSGETVVTKGFDKLQDSIRVAAANKR